MATARSTGFVPGLRIIDHIEPIHPDQTRVSNRWRWGPYWESDGRSGIWVVERTEFARYGQLPVAIRCEFDETCRVLAWLQFHGRLVDIRDGALDVDESLRQLDEPKPARKRRPAVPKVIADDIAALNELARDELPS